MLELCTSIVKKELKSVKREGSCVVYVTRLGNQLYSTVLEVQSNIKILDASAKIHRYILLSSPLVHVVSNSSTSRISRTLLSSLIYESSP